MNPPDNPVQPDQPVLIDEPDLLTSRERTRDTIVTAVMWGIYIYLWVPLASLFAWLLGFEFAYDVMIRTGGARDLSSILIAYGLIVVVIFAMVAIWSLGNLLRYGKLVRRHSETSISLDQMAEVFDIDADAVARLRSTPSVSIDFDADGRPVIGSYPPEV